MAITTPAKQSGRNRISAFDEIHIIGTAIGARGTLDSDSRAALELAREWADLGVPVTLYTDHPGYLLAQSHNLHNVVYCVWPAERWRRFGRPVHPLAKSLIGWLHARRIKTTGLIYSASDSWADVLASQHARRLNPTARWVGKVQTIDPKYFLSYAANMIVTDQIKRNADLFFAVGAGDKARFADKLGGRAYGLRLGIGRTADEVAAAKRKRFDVCFIASGESIGGWTQLADTWRHVRMYKPGAKLAVMVGGSKGLSPLIKRLFVRRGLVDDVTWLFDPDERVKRQTLLAGRIFISPFTDTNSVFIAEAMAAGLPVIGFDTPGLRSDYRMGLMTVPTGDWGSLGHLVIHILNHRGLYLRLKRQAKAEAATRDWGRCAGQALDFLKSA